jgi:hypothetical protein
MTIPARTYSEAVLTNGGTSNMVSEFAERVRRSANVLKSQIAYSDIRGFQSQQLPEVSQHQTALPRLAARAREAPIIPPGKALPRRPSFYRRAPCDDERLSRLCVDRQRDIAGVRPLFRKIEKNDALVQFSEECVDVEEMQQRRSAM